MWFSLWIIPLSWKPPPPPTWNKSLKNHGCPLKRLYIQVLHAQVRYRTLLRCQNPGQNLWLSLWIMPFSCVGTPSHKINIMVAVLRIRDVYTRSEFFPSRIWIFPIPDPYFFHHGSTSRNLSILTPKNWFLSSQKYDPGCSFGSGSRILIFYPSRIRECQKGTGSRIRIRNTEKYRGCPLKRHYRYRLFRHK